MADEGLGKETLNAVSIEQQQQSHRGCEVEDLEGWSTRVEDLVDGGDEDGAVQLLQKVVENFQTRRDAGRNLGLAAALDDLGRIYASQGLSLKSDELFNSALLIRHRREQEPVESSGDALTGEHGADEQLRNEVRNARSVGASASSMRTSDLKQSSEGVSGKAPIEDWEAILDALPTPLSTPRTKALQSSEKSASKQRGRGSFTYGGFGMYSDNIEMTGQDDGELIGSQIGHCRFPLKSRG